MDWYGSIPFPWKPLKILQMLRTPIRNLLRWCYRLLKPHVTILLTKNVHSSISISPIASPNHVSINLSSVHKHDAKGKKEYDSGRCARLSLKYLFIFICVPHLRLFTGACSQVGHSQSWLIPVNRKVFWRKQTLYRSFWIFFSPKQKLRILGKIKWKIIERWHTRFNNVCLINLHPSWGAYVTTL